MICTVAKVLYNKEISENIYEMAIEGDYEAKSGQFYMLKTLNEEFLLPRPISVHDVYEDRIVFLYQVAGKGTKVFSKLKDGDEIQIMGSLGNGFDVDSIKGNIAIVAGGIGIAPIRYLSKNLKDCNIDLYCGYRNEAYALEEIKPNVKSINIATEHGEVGHKGYVTDLIDVQKYDLVITCGPEIMMNKVVKMCREKGIACLASLENRMACGIGACLGCTCKTTEGNKRTCKEGPVFFGEDLVINE